MTDASILVVQHEPLAPVGWFGEWLSAAGARLDVRRGDLGEEIPTSLTDHDALIVLGGVMNAYDDAACPWLTPTKQLIAAAVDREQPFLGICLGHQLAAVALGGVVDRNPHGPGVGLSPVGLLELAGGDVVAQTIEPDTWAVQWNYDVVTTLPDGAVRLTSAPDGTVQMARFGPAAWGVQFHPEASPAIFAGWTGKNDAVEGHTAAEVRSARAAIDRAEADLVRWWRPVAERFGQVAAIQRLP